MIFLRYTKLSTEKQAKTKTHIREEKMEKTPGRKTKIVICVSCHKEVEVELVPYSDGHIATCPLCGKLAYNGE